MNTKTQYELTRRKVNNISESKCLPWT